jgi:hypothetical protein
MKHICVGLIAAAVFLLHALWTGERTLAASRYSDDLAELSRIAQAVIEVEVIGIESAPDSKAAMPLTRASVKIRRIYKGNVDAEDLSVAYPGGNDGAHQTICPGQPALVAGHRYVLFVARFSPAAGWCVVGGEAGAVELIGGSDGTIARRQGSLRFEYFAPDSKSLTGTQRIERAVLSDVEFSALLETIVETGRPVVTTPVSAMAPVSASAPVATLSETPGTAAVLIKALATILVVTIVWLVGTRYVAR